MSGYTDGLTWPMLGDDVESTIDNMKALVMCDIHLLLTLQQP